MDFLENLGNQKLPSIISDPFNKASITRVYLNYQVPLFGDQWKCNGSVDFKSNNTRGTQQFEADTFDEVVIQIREFIKTLE